MTFEWKHPKYYKELARIRKEEEEKEKGKEEDGKRWEEESASEKI